MEKVVKHWTVWSGNHHPQKYLKNVYMWHLEIWFSGGFGRAGSMVRLGSRGLFQPKEFCCSVLLYNSISAISGGNNTQELECRDQSSSSQHFLLAQGAVQIQLSPSPGWLCQLQAVLTHRAAGAGAGRKLLQLPPGLTQTMLLGPAAPNPTMVPQCCSSFLPSPGSHVPGRICCCRPSLDVPMLF